MEFNEYGRHIRRHWILLATCTLLGILVAGFASALMPPVYKSTTKLFVATQSSGSVLELQQGNNFTQQRVQSYVLTATTPAVLQPVIDSLALPLTSTQMAEKVAVSAELNTVVISITAGDSTPGGSALIASGIADSLIRVIGELEATGDKAPLKLTVVAPAQPPVEPSSPNLRLNLAIGLIVGLALGVAAVVLRTVLNTRIRGESDLHHVTNAAILGGVPFDHSAAKRPLLTDGSLRSARAEAFRQVRTNLQFTYLGKNSRALMFTSAIPGEGKTSSCINLALTLAEAGQSVVVVDADLRKPSVAKYLGLEQRAGLTTALIGHAGVDDLLQRHGTHELYILTSGQVPPNPSELLGSGEMIGLLRYLEERFDHVLIDAPPLLPVTDASVLAQEVGGVVVVVGVKQVRHAEVKKALASLKLVNARVVGIILNRLPERGPDADLRGYGNYELPAVEASAPTRADKLRELLRRFAADHLSRPTQGLPADRSKSIVQEAPKGVASGASKSIAQEANRELEESDRVARR